MALYPLWQWLVLIPAAVLATIVGWFFTVLVSLAGRPDIANTEVAARWARFIARLTPMSVDVEGREHVKAGQSYVVVANHLSQFDIPLVYGYSDMDLRWVIKAELGRVPFVAHGCRAIGHIFVERGNPEQSRQAINDAVARLQPGTSVLFFAEGTRSRSGQLMPFRKGAFRVAADQQLPILPITVRGTWQIMRPGSLRICPGRARIIIHPPIVPLSGDVDSNVSHLSQQAHDAIASALGSGHAGELVD